MDVSKILVTTDRIMDYIPFVSFVNNAVDAGEKIYIHCWKKNYIKTHPDNPYGYRSTFHKKHFYMSHVNNKSIWACVGLAIPFVNIGVALCREVTKHIKKDKHDCDYKILTLKRPEELKALFEKPIFNEETSEQFNTLNTIPEALRCLNKSQKISLYQVHHWLTFYCVMPAFDQCVKEFTNEISPLIFEMSEDHAKHAFIILMANWDEFQDELSLGWPYKFQAGNVIFPNNMFPQKKTIWIE